MGLTKFIVRFIGEIVEVLAALTVGAFGIAGAFGGAAAAKGAVLPALIGSIVICGALGAGAGFLCAVVMFGIPMLFLRMNANLEEIHRSLRSIDGLRMEESGVQRSRVDPTMEEPAVWRPKRMGP